MMVVMVVVMMVVLMRMMVVSTMVLMKNMVIANDKESGSRWPKVPLAMNAEFDDNEC